MRQHASGGTVPSQQQVRWAQLRVGLTVLFAAITLSVLIFLMSGTGGFFAKRLVLIAYFENASGLRQGAPVRLEGVGIGNVSGIRIVPDKPLTPVQVFMKINADAARFIHRDSLATLETAGVLGETFVDISSKTATGPQAQNGDVLRTLAEPDLQDVIRASQTSLQNVDILVRRLDRIIASIESGQGSIGKLIYDPSLYNRLNSTLSELQSVTNQVSSGKGSIGKLINDDELYNKLNDSVTRVQQLVNEIDQGNGTVGKLLRDPALYNNANATIAKANQLMENVNAGKGALGKLASDPAFAQKLDNTLTKLSALSDRLEAGQGSAGMLLRDPSLYNNADQMLVETRKLVQAVRENPKRYLTIRFKMF
jgi:phospholipid/cholesterol/gamma-HCH transport system substrate-binding protein